MDFRTGWQGVLSWLQALPGAAKIGLAVGTGAVLLAGGVAVAYPKPTAAVQTLEAARTAAPTATAKPTEAVPAAAEQTSAEQQSTLLSATQDAGRRYLDETLFIGDSNTARYMMYADETGTAFTTQANNIGVVSMGAQAITTLKCEQFSGYKEMYTIPDAVAMLKPRRIVICFGTNNLSGTSTDATTFIQNYAKGLQAIETAWPYADLIVSAIPPLDDQRENTRLSMIQVDAYNEAILSMCEENGWYFLNSAEVLRDESTGWAKKDYTLSDGVHLSKTAVTEFFTYVRTHALVTEDRRPQPLGNIPTPVGPPVNLISQDPIAVRGAKVPLEFVATNGGSLSGSTSQLVKKGATASAVTAVPDGGFRFDGWTASNGASYGGATISFTMPSNADAGGVVLTAHFSPDEHEHDYREVEGSRTSPTCLLSGNAKYRCTICGEIIEKELPALGHKWNEGVLNTEGTRKVYTCVREGCGVTKEEILATPTPKPTAAPTPSQSPTQAPTQTPDQTPTQAPTEVPTQPPVVTPTPEPTPVHQHSYTESILQEPTCGTSGAKRFTCSCGDTYDQEIPPTEQHSLTVTETVPPQPGADGYETSVCGVCGYTKTTTLPALPVTEPEPPASSEENPAAVDEPTPQSDAAGDWQPDTTSNE